MLNLELLRRERRLTQVHLATKARVSQATISAVEAGVQVPSPEVLERLADALDFSPPERLLRRVRVTPEPEEGAMCKEIAR